MIHVPGYAVAAVLRESRRSRILRAVRESDGAPVVLKALRREHPSLRDVARLRHEHAILGRFSDESVIGSRGLVELGSRAVLVLEDFGGAALSERIPREGLPLAEFLAIAPRLVRAVAAVHAAGVLHKDIKPDNIIVSPDLGRVALADFSIASVLAEEPGDAGVLEVLEGSLAYLAPEQTGRMNRPVDYRSDYYALGATFYEMLTGAPPFDSTDPMELVHAHVARVPVAPRERRAEVPPALSELVMRLLAKTAEGRYQSAAGLLADLERVAAGQASFTLGEHDVSEQFILSSTLYGREGDAEALLLAFDRVTAGGNECVLLAGPAGIGKSALVREIHRPLVRHRGYFCSGKFDQLARNSPYSALAQALRGYVLQILGENEARLAVWRAELTTALAPNARVLFDTLPELARLLGAQPPVPELPPAESANRFHAAFRALIRALAGERHPAAIFLDDLQWSDPATLKLIEELAGDPELPHILWIGAYRDDEVGVDHPLARTIAAVVERGAAVTRKLPALARADVARLIADSLRCDAAAADGLAAVVHDRSEGNPLFVRTYLQSLHDQGALILDRARGAWTWSEGAIGRAVLPDDVVDLVARRIAHLPDATQAALRLAACCGNRFDVHLLARIEGRTADAVLAGLWPAVDRGLLRPVGDDYKYLGDDARAALLEFVHDRVQQVAYGQIGADVRPRLHLAAGRTLLALRGEADDDGLFAVAGHLSRAGALITDADERVRVAGLDLRAARRAKAATAYGSAGGYLAAGVELLAEDAWETAYPLAFALHRERVECEYLAGDPEAAIAVFVPLLARARTNREKAELHGLRAVLETNRGDLRAALAAGRAGLALYDVTLPEVLTPADVMAAFEEYQGLRAGISDDALRAWPEATDEEHRVRLRIMVSMTAAAYFTDTNLASVLLLRAASQSLRHGLVEVSAYGLIGVGLVLSGAFGRYAEADAHGRLAHDLNERFGNAELRARIALFWATFMMVWTRPFAEVQAALREAFELGMQSGDIIYAVYSAVTEAFNMVLAGDPLLSLIARVEALLPLVRRRGLADQVATLRHMKAVFGGLADATGAAVDVGGIRAGMSDAGTPLAMFYAHLYDAIAAYVRGDDEAAGLAIAGATPRAFVAFGSPIIADLRFFECLILARAYAAADADERARIAGVVARGIADLTTWAASAPANYAAREALARGEWAAATGDDGEALRRHNQAIALAREHRAPHIEAIACECALRFAAARGFPILVRAYLGEAIAGYRAWGAAAKVTALAREFGEQVAELTPMIDRSPVTTATMTRSTSALALDLETVLKAGQAISGELQMDRLLRRLIGLLVENAGARRGVLVVAHDDGLRVEAEASVDGGSGAGLGVALDDYPDIPHSLIHHAARLQTDVVLADARVDPIHGGDPYVVARGSRSILCTPVLYQNSLACVVFLEHDLAAGAFTRRRLTLIKQLAVQMAISLTNARLYRSLDEARIAALAADRAKTRFLMNMSHELRTPLNAILGYTELIAENAAHGDLAGLDGDLRAIHRAGVRLLRSVSAILELTRLETDARAAQLAPVIVGPQVRDLALLYQGAAAERGNSLVVTVPEGLPPIVTDGPMLRYILSTLLDNACRFTQDGRVAVTVVRVDRGEEPWLAFAVADTGIGVDAEVLPTIFGAFIQGDESSTRRFEGTGVSLAVAQRFCELIGGELQAESTPGVGTTVTLRLPIDPGPRRRR